MWLLAEDRYKHRQALCQGLLHNFNLCKECNIRVVVMVLIQHHIPDAKYGKFDTGAASVICIATLHKNKRHGTIYSPKQVCNATRRFCNGYRLILPPRV
jgi:hypothetical protein